jgi:hypothetical protein
MHTSKPLCWVPYYSAEITYKETKPCCKFNYSDLLPYPNIQDFDSDSANVWRKESFMGQELADQCRACKVPDGVHNFERQNRKEFIKLGWTAPTRPSLRKLIIGMDNICASSCIQCGPHFSSTLNNLAKTQDYKQILGQEYQLPGTQQIDFNQLEGKLADLEVLHLYGGEPLISPNLEKLVTMLRSQSPKLRRVGISTGLTRIKERNVALLAELGVPVLCNISLDGPIELNSWIRGITPDEFTQSWDMLLKYGPNIRIIGFQTTIGSYNTFALPEHVKFMQSLWPQVGHRLPPHIMSTIIHKPEQLHPKQLQTAEKNAIVHKLTEYLPTAPTWARELITTAIHAQQEPATIDWALVQRRMNTFGFWRGDTRQWQQQYDHYMGG